MRKNKIKTGQFLIAILLTVGGPCSSGLAASASDDYCARVPNPSACRANEEQRRKQREEIRMRNTPHQATQAIERTIEGFTLGMSSSDATRLLTSGIQKGQFKVEITQDLVGREFPMISDYPGSLPGLDVPTKKSWIFSTAAAKGIQLFFYESKLYWIGIDSYARAKLLTALTEKYGPPFRLKLSRWCAFSANAWTDNRTTINYCELARFRYPNNIDLVLNYLDQQLVSRMENYDTQTRQKQEGEKRRKSETLPKNY